MDGWTDWLTGKSPESLSREGFDDEYRLCWRGLQVRVMLATVARGTDEPRDDRIGECGAAAATRRTEPGNMATSEDRITRGYGGVRWKRQRGYAGQGDGSRCGQKEC